MRLTHLLIQVALVAFLVTGVACQRKTAEEATPPEGTTQEQTQPAPEGQPEAPAEQPAEGTGQ